MINKNSIIDNIKTLFYAFLIAIFVESTLTNKLYLDSKAVMLIAVDLPQCNLTM